MDRLESGAPLVLVRGLPGSGKSTFARMLVREYVRIASGAGWARDGLSADGVLVFETDDFFVSGSDFSYTYDGELASLAHSWNEGRVAKAMRDSPRTIVVVANCMCRLEEMVPYARLAKRFGRRMVIFELGTAHENEHGVDADTMGKMSGSWEPMVPGMAIAVGDDDCKAGLARNFMHDVCLPGAANKTGRGVDITPSA